MRFEDLLAKAKNASPKRIIGVAAAEDEVVLTAVANAVKENICKAKLFGDKSKIIEISQNIGINSDIFEIFDCVSTKESIKATMNALKNGEIDLPMKGHCTTAELLSEYLKDDYYMKIGKTMNLVSVFEIPAYHKLLIVTDAGMIINPSLKQKIDEVNTSVNTARKLGIANPKVAVLGAVETVNPKMIPTVEAAIISQMNNRKQIKNCVVDGPLAMDNAISKRAARLKGIKSVVAGDADILIMPSIECGNIFYKSMMYFAGAKVASVILGGKKPVILTSRADSDETKLMSIALSVLMV